MPDLHPIKQAVDHRPGRPERLHAPWRQPALITERHPVPDSTSRGSPTLRHHSMTGSVLASDTEYPYLGRWEKPYGYSVSSHAVPRRTANTRAPSATQRQCLNVVRSRAVKGGSCFRLLPCSVRAWDGAGPRTMGP